MREMTSRERVLAAIRREPVDHVPCVPSFNALSKVLRRDHTWNFPWSESASREEQIQYQVETLGTDAVIHAGAGLVEPHPDVTSRTWIEDGVLHKAYDTPSGELKASMRYTDTWPHGEDIPFYSDFNVGHATKPWIRTEADLACFKHVHRLSDSAAVLDRARRGLKEARNLAGKYGLPVQASCGMGLTGAQHLFGVDGLCLMAVDNPDLIDAYLAYEHSINVRTVEVLGEGNVDIVRRNGFYETADFFSPQMLDRFLGKFLRAEVAAAHAAGMVTSYTVHTGVMPILDHLAGLPFDSLFGIDIAFGGVEIERVQEKLAPTKSFYIGPSSTYHLWNGAEPTREGVRKVFEVFGKTGLIISQCVSAHSIMPWESTLAMIEVWKELR